MTMKVSDLSIELTRMCDAGCTACFRGGARSQSISRDTLLRIFDQVGEVRVLTLCGGEPLADAVALASLIEAIKEKKPKINCFWCVSSFVVDGLEEKLKLLDELNELVSSKWLSRLCRARYSEAIESSELNALSALHQYVSEPVRSVDRRFSYYIENRKFPQCMESTSCPSYINGFCLQDGEVVTPFRITATGNVVTSSELSYDDEDSGQACFGSLYESSLEEIVNKNLKSSTEIRSLELVDKKYILFSQYWDSLPEENRGDYFGYVLGKVYGRDIPGFGIFEITKNHKNYLSLPEFSDFSTLVSLRSEVAPAWATEDDLKFEPMVVKELFGYVGLLCARLFRNYPLFEIVDLYYHDMPYHAGNRLNRFLEDVFQGIVGDNRIERK